MGTYMETYPAAVEVDCLAVCFQGELIKCDSLNEATAIAQANRAMDCLHCFQPEQLEHYSAIVRRHGKLDAAYEMSHIARRMRQPCCCHE
jgi:hypothetical protein